MVKWNVSPRAPTINLLLKAIQNKNSSSRKTWESLRKKSFGSGKKSFGSETHTEIGPWFRAHTTEQCCIISHQFFVADVSGVSLKISCKIKKIVNQKYGTLFLAWIPFKITENIANNKPLIVLFFVQEYVGMFINNYSWTKNKAISCLLLATFSVISLKISNNKVLKVQ